MSLSDKPRYFPALICIIPLSMTILLLTFWPSDGGTFTSLMFFFVILAIALIGAYMVKDQGLNEKGVPFFTAEENKEYGNNTLQKEREGLDKWDLILLPVGTIALIGAAIVLVKVGGPILALFAGGGLLMLLLMRSQTVIIPWAVHAAYNITVVVSSQFELLPGLTFSASPIFVPFFNFDVFVPEDIIFQTMIQVVAVALTEEVMRVSAAMGFSILLPIGRWGALGLSTIGWAIAHTIQAYRF